MAKDHKKRLSGFHLSPAQQALAGEMRPFAFDYYAANGSVVALHADVPRSTPRMVRRSTCTAPARSYSANSRPPLA